MSLYPSQEPSLSNSEKCETCGRGTYLVVKTLRIKCVGCGELPEGCLCVPMERVTA